MNYNIIYGDKKSIRYDSIEELYSRHQQLQSGLQGYSRSSLHNYEGSGLRNNSQSCTNHPNELVDRLNLLCSEKKAGNDSFLLNEQMIAIADRLLEYECITPS